MASRTLAQMGRRARRVWLRARSAGRRRDRQRTTPGRMLTAAVCVLAGLLVMVSTLNARGIDLRPGRNTDLVSLVESQSRRNQDLVRRLTASRVEVDRLTTSQGQPFDLTPALAQQADRAGLSAMTGQAVTVTLSDAPDMVAADGVDADFLIVHQQDIQAVVNALWTGGAEAMTIQGQRVISTTGIKCVGNTVVLHGIPYAPPYVISALGDRRQLRAALNASAPIRIYQQYVDAYGLGFRVRNHDRLVLPAHQGLLEFQYAKTYRGDQTPSDPSTPR